jgi:hypothetical protein
MKPKYKRACLCLLLLVVSGCGILEVPGMLVSGLFSKKTKQKSQLEIREMQTRTYPTRDVKMIMKAMMNVLQDDNFIIKQVNMEMGFFNAAKEFDVEDSGEKMWKTFWAGKNATYKKNSTIECTTNISEFGNEMKVRANFQVKVMDNKGAYVLVGDIDDPIYYQNFFSKVDKGIFIEKEKL